MGWGGRWEGGSGWRTHVNPWLIHVNVWQKPLQYCKVISLQLMKIIGKKNKKEQQKKKERKLRRKAEAGELPVQRSLWARCDDASGKVELPWGGCFLSNGTHLCAENAGHGL